MAYLSSIVEALEAHFQIIVHGEHYHRTLINGVRFANEHDADITHLAPNILYLADYKKFKEKEVYGEVLYIDCGTLVPQKSCIYIAEDLDIFELYNVISECLLNYQRIRQNGESLFNMLYTGKGITALLRSAYSVLNNPITVLDSSFSSLAFYPDMEKPIFEVKNGAFVLNNKVLSNMKNSSLLSHIYHSVYPFKTYVEDLDTEMVFESIRIQRAVVGYICIRCSNHPISDDELEYIHSLTQMISIQLHQNETYQNPYGVKYDMFLKHLFSRHYDSEESIRRQLGFLNVSPRQNYYLVVSSFYTKDSRLMANDHYCHQLSNTFPNSITGLMGDRFVTLISTDDFPYFTPAVRDRFEVFLTMNKMKAAISYAFTLLLDADSFLEQCMSHLDHLLTTYTEHPYGLYSEYYIRHLAELSGKYDTAKASIHPSILRMAEYDAQNQTNYLETLRTYFAQNRNAPAAAKALFIHKSTLFYRFNKMSALFQIDFENKDALFAYEFSLHMMDILKSRETE